MAKSNPGNAGFHAWNSRMASKSVLFVCLGNICRSPLAEGVFTHLASQRGEAALYRVDSAGISGWHSGEGPDRRSVKVAAAHGIDISRQQSRQVKPQDFAAFDLILAMDRDNLAILKSKAPAYLAARVHLFNALAVGQDMDVPDPYYGGPEGFEAVYSMLDSGCSALLAKLADARAS